jgi:hypothetical protein
MAARRVLLGLVLLLASCTGGQEETAPAPPPTPVPTLGPQAPEPDEVDPCLLDAQEVGEVAGAELPLLGPSGGEVFAICTYGDPEAGLGTADIALVDLTAVSADTGEDIDGEDYIAELTDGAGTGAAVALDDLGDGSAVLLTYPFGSQAWGYVGGSVYGAYSSDLADDDAVAQALLAAVLAAVD